jgi:hypothetical protein
MAQAAVGSPDPDEDVACVTGRTVLVQIGGQSLADVRGQRQTIMVASLPADHESPLPPIDVIQRERYDFPRPETQPCDQKKKGPIPAAEAKMRRAVVDDALHLLWLQILGYPGQPPRRYTGHGVGQVGLGFSFLE